MQKGLGWTYFEDTIFAHWKASDCGLTSGLLESLRVTQKCLRDRAIAPNMWGAEADGCI